MNQDPKRTERTISGVVLVLLVLGCLLVLRPFASALMWAVVLSFSAWPVYRRVLAAVGERRTVAAPGTTHNWMNRPVQSEPGSARPGTNAASIC